jgi:hypothetical protein
MCLKEDSMMQILVVGNHQPWIIPRGYLIVEQAVDEGVTVQLCALTRRERRAVRARAQHIYQISEIAIACIGFVDELMER